MNEFNIEGRFIGDNHKPVLIAELGINHNGSLDTAFKMVDAAIESGIEIIKHQTHVVEDEMSQEAKKVIPGNSDKSIYQIMEECSLNEEDEIKLKEYVEDKGAIFISTPFSRAAAERLNRMNVSAYKIGSGECNNYPLIDHIADFGKPIILSTGMNTIESIRPSVEIFREKNIPFALLHTTNIYPTANNLVRLSAMKQLQNEFPDAVIGLSDHTITNHACFGAVALGASILERHFTDTMEREGPDIVCSMDPNSAEELLDGIGILFDQRGGMKGPVAEETPTINFAFATVVTIKEVKVGDKFSKDNLWVKRPGTGSIKADKYQSILGKTASRDLPSDFHISFDNVQDVDH